MGAPEVIRRLRDYADERALPISEVRAWSIGSGPSPVVMTSTAAGADPCRRWWSPPVNTAGRGCPGPFAPAPGLTVLHSSDYRGPGQLPEGAVLVIGGGSPARRSPGPARRWSQRVLVTGPAAFAHPPAARQGLDDLVAGRIHQHVSESAGVLAGGPDALRKARTAEFPLISGKGSAGLGSSISLLAMHRAGIRLLGRLQEFSGNTARFADVRPQLHTAIEATRAEYAYLDSLASAYYATRPEPRTDDARYIPEEVYLHWEPEPSPCKLDLKAAGIRAVVLATGFVAEWPGSTCRACWMHTAIRLATSVFPRSRGCSSSACTTCSG